MPPLLILRSVVVVSTTHEQWPLCWGSDSFGCAYLLPRLGLGIRRRGIDSVCRVSRFNERILNTLAIGEYRMAVFASEQTFLDNVVL